MNFGEWKIIDNEIGLAQLENWMRGTIEANAVRRRAKTPGLTGTAFAFLMHVYLYSAKHDVFVVPTQDVVDTMIEHGLAKKQTIMRACEHVSRLSSICFELILLGFLVSMSSVYHRWCGRKIISRALESGDTFPSFHLEAARLR